MSRRSRLQLLGMVNARAAMAPSQRPVMLRGAWTWTSGMAIDDDGDPMAYALHGSGLVGHDDIRNAGGPPPKPYYGLAHDWMGQPCVQGAGDPAPGFAVSASALVDHARPTSDPRRYVDAWSVPYIVTPPELIRDNGIRLGDLAAVKRGDKLAFAIVADVGPHGHYGEASPACAELVGVPKSPINGGCSYGVTYIIFPASCSTPAWPRSTLELQADAARRYAAWTTSG